MTYFNFHALFLNSGYYVLFRMNRKELEPPPVGAAFIFYFKNHPASFKLQSHLSLWQALSAGKNWAKNFLLRSHSLETADK